ncbi:MAG: glycosyltransferase [Rhodospirillales bacterium]|nr:glycosyltransferase [Rhodospirillales bacterium]
MLDFPLDTLLARPVLAAGPRIAVLVPCRNEALAIAKVVADFRAALPDATVYVYDNGSADRTAAIARAAGAVVRGEDLPGKGNVVRRMFADIEADIFVLVDGDDTYDAEAAPAMVQRLCCGQLDMVSAARVADARGAYRAGHRLGNAVLTGMVRFLFGDRVSDVLSGYRVFSRRFVKSFPALATGFETETEFTVHALELRMPIAELPAAYRARPVGTASKLRTYADGWRILRAIVALLKQERPLAFFAALGGLLFLLGAALGLPVIATYLQSGLVPRLPTAVLATGIELLGGLCVLCGLVLDSVARGRKEMKRLAYLSIPALPAQCCPPQC